MNTNKNCFIAGLRRHLPLFLMILVLLTVQGALTGEALAGGTDSTDSTAEVYSEAVAGVTDSPTEVQSVAMGRSVSSSTAAAKKRAAKAVASAKKRAAIAEAKNRASRRAEAKLDPTAGGAWEWKNNNCYYKLRTGKYAHGLTKIGRRMYLFDSNGVQRTGWREISGKYYYFRNLGGSEGYMLRSRSFDGITLAADGHATPTTERAQRKLPLMVRVSKIVDSQCKLGEDKATKLYRMFMYIRSHYTERVIPVLVPGPRGNWDIVYASFMLNTGGGDCYCYGALFAYFAHAIGYRNVTAENSGGHGWARIEGKFYDPEWSMHSAFEKCYAVPVNMSGVGGRLTYATSAVTRTNLDY